MKRSRLPLPAVRRLCIYRRYLEKINFIGKPNTSSTEISAYTGIPSYQVRKDINHLGEVGIVGFGYDTAELIAHINIHFESYRPRKCVLVGMGALGTALARYFTIASKRLTIIAGFDIRKEKFAQPAENNMAVYPLEMLKVVVSETGAEIGIIAVPAASAKVTAEKLIGAGIKGILNFTPVMLNVPSEIIKADIDFLHEIEIMEYQLSSRSKTET